MRTLSTTEPLLAIARIGQRVTAIVSFYRPSNGAPAHGRARLRATHTRCGRLGWRHVRDLCLPAPGARHARAAATPAVDARHVPEILSLGVDGGPAAARQRLFDGVHSLRRFCRCRSARLSDARDWLADDRFVRVAIPRTVAGIRTRRRR